MSNDDGNFAHGDNDGLENPFCTLDVQARLREKPRVGSRRAVRVDKRGFKAGARSLIIYTASRAPNLCQYSAKECQGRLGHQCLSRSFLATLGNGQRSGGPPAAPNVATALDGLIGGCEQAADPHLLPCHVIAVLL